MDTKDYKDYNLSDLRWALSYIRKEEMSIKQASFLFNIPVETITKLLSMNDVKSEKPKKKLKMKSIFTEELEEKVVEYVVNMGTKICAAKTHEERKTLADSLANKTLDLNFFNAPPRMKMLKVLVKRDKDKLPFYVIKITPSEVSHFLSLKTTNIKKSFRFIKDEECGKKCPEYELPHYEEGDTSLEKKYSGVSKKVPRRLDCNLLKIKGEVVELVEENQIEGEEQVEIEEPIEQDYLIQREIPIQEILTERVNPIESEIQIEFKEPILKEELNIEEWLNFEEHEFFTDGELENHDKVIVKEEPKTGPEEMVVEYSENLQLSEFTEMTEAEEIIPLTRYKQSGNKRKKLTYPLAQKKKKPRKRQ